MICDVTCLCEQIQQLQADLVEQQSINNYQIEAATQEREKVPHQARRAERSPYLEEPLTGQHS